jgi:hypothetical protein
MSTKPVGNMNSEKCMSQSSATGEAPTDVFRGRWIAWDEKHERVIAVADTYSQLLGEVSALGMAEPDIERAPGLNPAVAERAFELIEGESPDVLEDVRRTIPDPDEWLDTPNLRLRCQKPRDLVGTPQEPQLRFLLRGIWSGITT